MEISTSPMLSKYQTSVSVTHATPAGRKRSFNCPAFLAVFVRMVSRLGCLETTWAMSRMPKKQPMTTGKGKRGLRIRSVGCFPPHLSDTRLMFSPQLTHLSVFSDVYPAQCIFKIPLIDVSGLSAHFTSLFGCLVKVIFMTSVLIICPVGPVVCFFNVQ